MKTQSDNKPESIKHIGKGNYHVNMNVREVERKMGETTMIIYEYDTIKTFGYPTYGVVVDALIRERYTQSDELAIQRQRDTKPDSFAEYNDYCEWCKSSAKPIFFPDKQQQEEDKE